MKWKMFVLAAIAAVAVSASAQESRQDVSISASGFFPMKVVGDTVTTTADDSYGALASYRFMVTPRVALELNYQYLQTTFYSSSSANAAQFGSRVQELSGAFVYGRNFGNFNPFVEAGPGGFVFSPIQGQNSGFNPAQNTNVGLIYGAGLAYEISPSFDIRAEYRGIVTREPSFSIQQFRTGRYTDISDPVIGVAYHF